MTETTSTPPVNTDKPDERVKTRSSFRQALIRPELGGICGTILVFTFFLLTASDSGMFSASGVMNWYYRYFHFMHGNWCIKWLVGY